MGLCEKEDQGQRWSERKDKKKKDGVEEVVAERPLMKRGKREGGGNQTHKQQEGRAEQKFSKTRGREGTRKGRGKREERGGRGNRKQPAG